MKTTTLILFGVFLISSLLLTKEKQRLEKKNIFLTNQIHLRDSVNTANNELILKFNEFKK